jgi:DNA-binding CsgD family transcriptional regulator/signal transduction histidine kinase
MTQLARVSEIRSGGPPVAETRPAPDRTGGEIALAALADLVIAPRAKIADRAQAALRPSLAHDALVLVTPGSPAVPTQIAAANELRERLAALEWGTVVDEDLRPDGDVSRLVLPDVTGGLCVAGWVARSAGCTVALVVGAQHPLSIGPAQEAVAHQVAMLAAARVRGIEQDPSPGTLAFSHAVIQERERVRSELRSRHTATLSSLLQTLRRATGSNGSRTTPPEVVEAIDLASQALLDLKAASNGRDAALHPALSGTFADAETEVRRIVRAGRLQLISGLDGPDDAQIPRAIAQVARIITRAAAVNATEHADADKLRVHWRLADDTLGITIADNGAGFDEHDDRPSRELAYMRRRVAGLRGTVELDTAPHWGTAVSCRLPLHALPLAPETPALQRISQLRDREREVLELMVAGLRNRDIAERLFITVRTVKFHVSNILRKLDVHSRTEAIALVHAAGISPPEET